MAVKTQKKIEVITLKVIALSNHKFDFEKIF